MTDAALHYERLLAPVYVWMAGGFDAGLEHARALLDDLGVDEPRGCARAVDLGAGPGFHALVLDARGFAVTAVDASASLLRELCAHDRRGSIRAVRGDLLELSRALETSSLELALCVGDTLTHLERVDDVDALCAEVARALEPGGRAILAFRDYATREARGEQRFILVRADASACLTCFLEYAGDRVVVHDLLHRKEGERWGLTVSSYPKLRLAPRLVVESLGRHGLALERESARDGLAVLTARKG